MNCWMEGWINHQVRGASFSLDEPNLPASRLRYSGTKSVHHNFQRNETLPVGCKELLLMMVLTLGTEGLLGLAPSIFPASAPYSCKVDKQIAIVLYGGVSSDRQSKRNLCEAQNTAGYRTSPVHQPAKTLQRTFEASVAICFISFVEVDCRAADAPRPALLRPTTEGAGAGGLLNH